MSRPKKIRFVNRNKRKAGCHWWPRLFVFDIITVNAIFEMRLDFSEKRDVLLLNHDLVNRDLMNLYDY